MSASHDDPQGKRHSIVNMQLFTSNMTATNERPKKKVKFQHVPNIIAIELNNDIDKGKQHIWYIQEEIDRFKFDAALEAGVKLFNSYAQAPENSGIQEMHTINTHPHTHKFVTVGDFDDKYVEDAISLITNAATCNAPEKCTNEYNDSIMDDGEEICKRGLGYHFSRFRKRNKAWVRRMILTWHKKISSKFLEDDRTSGKMEVHLSQRDAKLNENCQRLLAMVSFKCSRHARQSALWRGRMDYEVAYPESSVFLQITSNGSVSKMDLHRKNRKI